MMINKLLLIVSHDVALPYRSTDFRCSAKQQFSFPSVPNISQTHLKNILIPLRWKLCYDIHIPTNEVISLSDEVKNIFKGFGLLGLLVLAVALLLFVGSFFIGVSADTDVGGGCIAVAFDKAFVMGADKIVAYENGAVITITDKELVQEIASHFVVANRTDLCDSRSGNILEIYNGNHLVRTVYWNGCCENSAEIYKADALHWLFPSGSQLGQLELPQDVYEQIKQIIYAQRDE